MDPREHTRSHAHPRRDPRPLERHAFSRQAARALVGPADAPRMGTLAHHEDDEGALAAPDVVKVAVDETGFALYFTRTLPRTGERILRHVGVYAFARETLLAFAAWPPGEAERRERLEQLR